MQKILTVCTGNICRSPVAAFALQAALPDKSVSSAGLHALVGRDVDADSAAAAEQLGVPISAHSARQFDGSIGRDVDLILVKEQHHRHEIASRWPQLVSKTFLLGHFSNGQEIPDPYRAGQALHLRVVELIKEGAVSWAAQIRALNR